MTKQPLTSDPTDAPPSEWPLAASPSESETEAALRQAIALHQAGELIPAERLYRSILVDQPTHSDTNHNLGILAMQTGHTAAALGHFQAALQADPANPRFWLSCIDALREAGQPHAARQMLDQGRKAGLSGPRVEWLSGQLRLPEPARTKRLSKRPLPRPQSRSAGQEEVLGRLIGLGKNLEAEKLARSLTTHYPGSGFAWKALGVVLERLDRPQESLLAKRNAVRLVPGDAEAHRNLGNALWSNGDYLEAEASFRRALVLDPHSPEALSRFGMLLQQLGKSIEALACCRQAVTLRPEYVEGHRNLARLLERQQAFEEAELAWRRVIELRPSAADGYLSLGNLLHRQGKSAEVCFREALALDPGDAAAHLALGVALHHQGRLAEAERAYREAIGLDPTLAEAHNNLAAVLRAQGRLADAEAEIAYCRVLELNPNLAAAHSNLGSFLLQQGRLAEAEASCRRAVELDASLSRGHSNLAGALLRLGRIAEATLCCRRALELDPCNADAHNNLGTSLREAGSYAEAELAYRTAIRTNPDLAEAHNNLGGLLLRQSLLEQAESCCRRALSLNPALGEAHTHLGNVLLEMGRLAETAECCRHALSIKPSLMEAQSLLLYCLSHDGSVTLEELLTEHLNFGKSFGAPLRAAWPRHNNSPEPDRPLRVGFVSADLRDHAVAYFLEPVLEELTRHSGLQLCTYANDPRVDEITRRLQCHFSQWTPVAGLSDDRLAQVVRADGIDILLDLSGHTAGHRLLTFARKPAPVQASWIGYPGTTGLHAMDYYLADRFFLPHSQFAGQFTEKLVHLPAVSPFLPPGDAPDVAPLPALRNGYLTLGSFNRMAKLNDSVVALWSQLLRVLPSARMILGAMPRDGTFDTLLERFEREGVRRDRLNLYPRTDLRGYLELHGQVDLCLDAFPYGGCTTTSHALWMGVPTLSMAGKTPAGREGMTFLSHAGLEDFIALDRSDFIAKGMRWAGDLETLSELRVNLRTRLRESMLGRPEMVASGLSAALRTMWRRWCAGLPPEAF